MGSSRKVIAVLGPGRAEVVDRPLPVVRDRFMLVKPVAIALNPTDWKHIDAGVVGAVVGCDYSGIVEAIGKGVRKKFKKGDRVYGVVHGCNRQEPDDGAFGNYILVKADVQSHIPDNLSFEEAATLGVGIITVCQGLYLGLGLDLPTSPSFKRTPVLIYGGSTATGSLGIQFAKQYVFPKKEYTENESSGLNIPTEREMSNQNPKKPIAVLFWKRNYFASPFCSAYIVNQLLLLTIWS